MYANGVNCKKKEEEEEQKTFIGLICIFGKYLIL